MIYKATSYFVELSRTAAWWTATTVICVIAGLSRVLAQALAPGCDASFARAMRSTQHSSLLLIPPSIPAMDEPAKTSCDFCLHVSAVLRRVRNSVRSGSWSSKSGARRTSTYSPPIDSTKTNYQQPGMESLGQEMRDIYGLAPESRRSGLVDGEPRVTQQSTPPSNAKK